MLTDKTVLKCFPHKEAILYNLDVAVSLAGQKIGEEERIDKLVWAYECLRKNDVNGAVQNVTFAGYECMARAIKLHYDLH